MPYACHRRIDAQDLEKRLPDDRLKDGASQGVRPCIACEVRIQQRHIVKITFRTTVRF